MTVLWPGTYCKVILPQSPLGNYLLILQLVTTLQRDKSNHRGEQTCTNLLSEKQPF